MRKAIASPAAPLFTAALEAEHARHSARIKAIRSMEKKLNLLEPHLPKLAEHGIKFEGGALHDLCDSWGGLSGLKLPTSIFRDGQVRLLNALLACGFVEQRDPEEEGRTYRRVTLKHGRLVVYFYMDQPPQAAQSVPKTADTTPA